LSAMRFSPQVTFAPAIWLFSQIMIWLIH